jgi:AcrR family transcriptional regulator
MNGSAGAALQERGSEGKLYGSNREKILESAVQVALRDGILAMTLDAVAREAGVSKGGLLYHFGSKDELLAGMLDHFCTKTSQMLEARIAADQNPRGRILRAFVQTVFEKAPAAAEGGVPFSEKGRFMMAMLAASANKPQSLELPRTMMCRMRERLLAEGPNGFRQLALWPAVHGLLLWQHLGLISADDPVRQAVLDELLALAEGPAPAAGEDRPPQDAVN